VSGQTETSATYRGVSNFYNRVPRPVQAYESTASWNYTTATVRQARATATNQVAGVFEVGEEIALSLRAMTGNAAGFVNISVGIGEDSTTTYAAGGFNSPAATVVLQTVAQLNKYPSEGYHVYSWNEWSTATGTTTWYSNIAGVGSTIQAGLSGGIR